jgi:hypothetical protein
LGSSVEALTFGGTATGAQVTVPATGTTIRAATGTVAISGGGAEAALQVGDIPGSATGGVVALSAGVMHSAIIGLEAARAEASMANITLTISNNTITADFIMARGAASCGPAASGSSILGNLVINGQPITVTGAPNQTVTLPNGTAIINDQTSSVAGTSAQITVNALHVTTTDPVTHQQLADTILAQAAPQIDCQAGSPPTAQFGTGGGYILAMMGGHANFGVVGGVQPNGSQMGHVLFEDHDTSFRLTANSLTSSTANCTTTITGLADTSSGAASFTITLHDVADPGAGFDEFSIHAVSTADNSVVYDNTGRNTVVGGNLQVHSVTCPQP